jgi:TRAP-type C4-dicarboxylate transport system substrate-binding protein
LPHGFPTGYVACLVMNDFYSKFKPKEWDKVHPLFFHANTPAVLGSTKPLRVMEDFKGQIIRAPGRQAEIIAALGGTPAPTPIMETYDAIAKGVIGGVLVGGEGLAAFRFAEVVKYVTNSWNIGSSYAFYVAMNKRSYDRLPADVKGVVDKLSKEYIEKMAVAWNNADFRGKQACKDKGVEWFELPQAEFQRWLDAMKPVVDSYKKEMVGKGYSEAEINGWIDFIAQRKDVQLQKQISIGLKSTTGPPVVR